MPEESTVPEPKKVSSTIQKLESFYATYKVSLWSSAVFIPLLIVGIGWYLYPEIVYDQFIWKYFWGTIEADAQETSYGDVTEEYNPVNTITYAIISIAVLYWIYKVFKKYEISIDLGFFISIIPFILVGGVARALEDAELFYTPTAYLFIAPIIYIFEGLLVIALVLIGVGFREFSKKKGIKSTTYLLAAFFLILDLIYLFIYLLFYQQFSYFLNPFVPVGLSILIILGLKDYIRLKKRFEISTLLFSVAMWFLLIGIIILTQWQSDSGWTNVYLSSNPGKDIQLQPLAFILVGVIALLATGIIYVLIKLLKNKYPKLVTLISAINLIIFFAHFLDASATFIAIDYYNYSEKHVVPTIFIEVFSSASVMLLMKAIIIFFTLYFIDVLYRKDFQSNPTLTGLVKLAILILGLAPGVRDVLRLGLGV